jgi:prepilin-type N-terminal cleavage/methylation domain-containing protein
MPRKNVAAFTLVELVVCVIVVGILVSFAAVQRKVQKGRAEYMSALTHVRSLANVIKNHLYNGGTLIATGSTAATATQYGSANIPEGTFFAYTVTPVGSNDFRIQALYDPTGRKIVGTGTTTFVWSSSVGTPTCSGVDCNIR